MIDNGKTYQILYTLRSDELRAHSLYLTCGYYLKGKGLECVARNIFKIAEQELEHAEELAARMQERGFFVPSPVRVDDITIDSVEYCLNFLRVEEIKTITNYSSAGAELREDMATFNVLCHIIEEEWKHLSYFDKLIAANTEGGYNALLNKSVARYTESEE